MSNLDKIEKLKQLLDDGALTEDEFEKQKSKILNNRFSNKKLSIGFLSFILIFGYFYFQDINNETQETVTSGDDITQENDELVIDEFIVNNIDKGKKATLKILTKAITVDINDQYRSESNIVRGTGSGFFIQNGDYVVTNYHVVAGSLDISVYNDYYKKEVGADLVGYSSCDDIAVLKVKEKFSDENSYYFNFSNEENQLGKKILNLGFPLGTNEITYSEGLVTKSRADGNTVWTSLDFAFEHDLGILPGSSGGPITDANFNIVGVAYAGNDYDQKFGIDGQYAQKVVEEIILSGKKTDSFGLNVEQIPFVGTYINSVDIGSVGEGIGLRGGEIITEFGQYNMETESNLKSYCTTMRASESLLDSPYIKWFDIDKLMFYESYLGRDFYTDNPLPIDLPIYTTLEIETFVKNTSFYWDPVSKQDYVVTYSGYPSEYQLLKLVELVEQYNNISIISSYNLYKFGDHPRPSSYHFAFTNDADEILDYCKFQVNEWFDVFPDIKLDSRYENSMSGEKFESEDSQQNLINDCERIVTAEYKTYYDLLWFHTYLEDSRGTEINNALKFAVISSESEYANLFPDRTNEVNQLCAINTEIYAVVRTFSGSFSKSKFMDSEILSDPKYESWFANEYCNGDFSQSLSEFDLKIIQIDQDPRLISYEVKYDDQGNRINSLDDFVIEFKELFGSDY